MRSVEAEPGANTYQLTVDVCDKWNMVSIPGLHPVDQNVGTWWPGKDPIANVFKDAGGYQQVDIAEVTVGYWMKNSGAQTYNTGDEWPAGGIQKVANVPISGVLGWNLIGGYEKTVLATGITTNPPGKIDAMIYGYNENCAGGSYYGLLLPPPDGPKPFIPGHAYWYILVNQHR